MGAGRFLVQVLSYAGPFHLGLWVRDLSVPASPSSVKLQPNSASYLLQVSDRRQLPAPLWVLTDLFFVML